MAKIDLNKSADLMRLKENMSQILESKIQSALIAETIAKMGEVSLGTLKNIFEGVVDKLSLTPAGEKVIGKYVRTIKENKDLQTVYCLYDVIENPSYLSDTSLFLSEAIEMSKGVNKKNLNEGEKKLAKVVVSAIKESKINNDELVSLIENNKTLNESINYLLTTDKKASNIFDYVNNMDVVNKYINENCPSEKKETCDKSIKEIVEEITDTVNNSLDESEAVAMRDIILTELSNGDKKELFENYKQKCLSEMENIIENSENVEEKARVSTMKEQLTAKEYSEETLREDVVTLSKLRNALIK